MLSDLLSETVDDIRYYQREMPECYDDLREWIDSVVREMEALRGYLDMPPPVADHIRAVRNFLSSPEDECSKWSAKFWPKVPRQKGPTEPAHEANDGTNQPGSTSGPDQENVEGDR